MRGREGGFSEVRGREGGFSEVRGREGGVSEVKVREGWTSEAWVPEVGASEGGVSEVGRPEAGVSEAESPGAGVSAAEGRGGGVPKSGVPRHAEPGPGEGGFGGWGARETACALLEAAGGTPFERVAAVVSAWDKEVAVGAVGGGEVAVELVEVSADEGASAGGLVERGMVVEGGLAVSMVVRTCAAVSGGYRGAQVVQKHNERRAASVGVQSAPDVFSCTP
ncbi:hypothetical protein ACWCSD_40740 [Nonomuraea sp. NPDC001684]